METPNVLFVAEDRDDPFVGEAMRFLSQHFPDRRIVLGRPGESLPDGLGLWAGDYLVSYFSPWIIPGHLLGRARISAINFHPAPPEYPGIGCPNFAIYDRARTYGVTCHHMARAVDTGKIVAVRRFPAFATETVLSLSQRAHSYLLILFYEIMSHLLEGKPLPVSDETWRRRPYTNAEMRELFRITPGMPDDEVRKRIKAGGLPGYRGAFVEVAGERFYHESPGDP